MNSKGRLQTTTSSTTTYNYRVTIPLLMTFVFSLPAVSGLIFLNKLIFSLSEFLGCICFCVSLIFLIKDKWIWKKKLEIQNRKTLENGTVIITVSDDSEAQPISYFVDKPLVQSEMQRSEENEFHYEFYQSISEMAAIDRVLGSLCIKEVNGKEYLADVSGLDVIHFENAKLNDPKISERDEKAYRKQLFKDFNPYLPVFCKLDYPLGKEIVFEIKPYEKVVGNRVLKYFPLGYVAWSIAKKYEEIYQDPEGNGIWGHGIEDLTLGSFKLIDNVRIEVEMGS